jgi:hypothetical protein
MAAAEQLRQWLDTTPGMNQAVFALKLAEHRGWGAQQSQISKWVSGTQKPSQPNRAAIEVITKGAVKAGDWEDPKATGRQKAARVSPAPKPRRRRKAG